MTTRHKWSGCRVRIQYRGAGEAWRDSFDGFVRDDGALVATNRSLTTVPDEVLDAFSKRIRGGKSFDIITGKGKREYRYQVETPMDGEAFEFI